jgi:hypothetical protein
MNDNGFWFWLGVVANLCQIQSYEMLLKDADNNELMKFLQHQDTDYLQTIIEQNKQIINQNKKILEKLKEGE